MLDACWTSYLKVLTRFVQACAHAFGRFGKFAVKRTLLLTIMSLILILIPFVGILRFRTESRGEKLWIPQKSESLTHRDWVNKNYGTSKGMAMFVATVKSNQPKLGKNVIQLPVTNEVFLIDEMVRSLEATHKGRTYRFEDLCYRDVNGKCKKSGYLNFWNMSHTTYLATVNGSATDPMQGDMLALLKSVNVQTFPDGSGVSTLSIFAGIGFGNTHPPALISAKAVQVIYLLDETAPSSATTAWLKKYLKLMKDQKKKTTYIQLEYYSSNSVDLEVARSISADMYLIAVSILVFIVVAILGLAKWDGVKSRASLGVIGLIGSVLAIGSGYCLSMAFGLPFTSLQQTLPYILGGVAIDIMLVMTRGMDDILLLHPDATMSERFYKLMAGPGLSVVVTTLASACAFALGTVSALPSISWFSAYATITVLAILVVQMSFFLAVFVYNERRIASNRLDCLCCVVRQQGCSCCSGPCVGHHDKLSPTVLVAAPDAKQGAQGVELAANGVRMQAPGQQDIKADTILQLPSNGVKNVAGQQSSGKRTGLSRFMEAVYAPTLLWWPVKVAVITVFVGYLIVSCIAIDKLKEGQPLEDVCPDDSWVIPFIKTNKETFWAQTGSSAGVYFRDLPFNQPQTQSLMLQALGRTLDNPYVNVTLSAFSSNWLMSFIGWAAAKNVTLDTTAGCKNPFVDRPEITSSGQLGEFLHPVQLPGCVPAEQFYPLLHEWTADPRHAGLKGFLVMGPDGKLIANNFQVQFKSSVGNDKYGRLNLEAAKHTGKIVNRQLFKSSKEVFFIYISDFIFGEGDAILKDMTFEYIGLAVLGVGVVMLIMLVHPTAAFLMMVAILLVDLFLFGEMWVLSIRFNSVSTINLVMATGLAVDYSVYVAAKFMTTPGATRNERVTIALAETGTAVLQGAVAALAGSIPLAFTSSVILRTFFSLIFGTILFSALVGLVLMPVLFSLIGPAALDVGLSAH